MIIADASLVAHLLIPGLDNATAEAVRSLDADWRAPGLWVYELRNVLVKYVRAGALTERNTEELMLQVLRAMHELELNAGSSSVISTALRSNISSYDAEYVAAAKTHGIALVTYDLKLAKAAPGIAFLPVDFLALVS